MNWYISIYLSDFPAQCYAAYHPEIIGIPYVIVRQSADSHKSAVLSLSPEAQARGIYHGFPVARLKERFGDVRIVQEDPSLAAAIAGDLSTVLSAFSPDVRVDRRGSAVVNVSGMQRLLAARFGGLPGEIRAAVKSVLALRACACGAAASPYMAAMAGRAAAPDGIVVCEKGAEAAMLAPVAASALPGLSDAVKQRLVDYNLRTVADIQRLSESFLAARFGEEGSRLYAMAHGAFLETRPRSGAENIESGRTLTRDENDSAALKSHIRYIADKLAFELRAIKKQAGSVAFTVRYSDNKAVRRSMRLLSPTADFTTLYECCCRLFEQACDRRIAVRRLSAAARPSDERECQFDLFDNATQVKQDNIGRSIGEIRMRMGFEIVRNGTVMRNAGGGEVSPPASASSSLTGLRGPRYSPLQRGPLDGAAARPKLLCGGTQETTAGGGL